MSWGNAHAAMLSHGEVLVRSSLRVKKKFGIRDKRYTFREHTDAVHNAKSSVQMNMASCFKLLRRTSFWPELKPLVFYHQITYTLHQVACKGQDDAWYMDDQSHVTPCLCLSGEVHMEARLAWLVGLFVVVVLLLFFFFFERN